MKKGQTAVTVLLFAWFLLTICGYYILRPVRSALILTDFGPQALPWVYMGTALVSGVAVWIYTRFTYLPRRQLFGGLLVFFTLNLLLWWGLAQHGSRWLSPVLYVWTDVYSIMCVTIFWIYANDVFETAGAKTAYGLIGSAGPLGAILGSGLTTLLMSHVSAVNMLGVAAAASAASFLAFAALEWATAGRSAVRARTIERFERYDLSGLKGVLKTLLASRTLLLLTVMVCFERGVPDFVDYIFQSIVHEHFPDRESFVAFFASFEFWRNILVFAATVTLTAPLLKRWGPGPALASVPATIAVVCGAFIILPGLAVVVALKGLEEGQRHAWYKAGKELVYTATNKEVIYKVKGYLEMFLYRMARGATGLLILLAAASGLGLRALALAAVVSAIAWAVCAWRLGRLFQTSENPENSLASSASAR